MLFKEISIQNEISELLKVNNFLEKLAVEWKLNSDDLFNINLITEEVVSNIIQYAFIDQLKHEIRIKFSLKSNILRIIFLDNGKAFNPDNAPKPNDLESTIKNRKIGGLGIYFVKNVVDRMEYTRKGDQNQLTLIKHIKS